MTIPKMRHRPNTLDRCLPNHHPLTTYPCSLYLSLLSLSIPALSIYPGLKNLDHIISMDEQGYRLCPRMCGYQLSLVYHRL
ncbi:hypothetical protein BO94DRAFT_340602 [Aspergillus sclerotioniger CBS 115572]|uniref:Uncharacterized protein n=1 Tax=Aspergillus sclerotioniger CBS 115572 TaxID=1450535 RepID=A0A317X4W9_9EURO|nr:hypothetical protein BO94DRAFT_340602 [Aspergillus sclerotioniger CBS 115572]PWY93375.1 hypothetical protein BO94DRAFT_340602 [Aspergillus sclerotioniger CBS 115572]